MRVVPGSGVSRGLTAAGAAGAVVAGLVVASLPSEWESPPRTPLGHTDARPHPRAADPSLRTRAHAVRDLLRRRADALRSRDETSFLASLDPKAPREFHERQHALFRNLAEVPLARWSYRIDSASARPAAIPVEPADELWAPRIVLSYALAEVDPTPTTRSVGYSFVRRGDSWYLAADSLPVGEAKSRRAPWEFGECRVVRTSNGLVIGHDRTQALSRRVAHVLDASVGVVNTVVGRDWPHHVGVLVPGSPEELRALVGPEFAVDGVAAVTVADHVDTRTRRVDRARIVLNPKTASQLSPVALRVVLQHEVTHIATRAYTVDSAPLWLLEGFADYVGYRGSGLAPREIAPDLTHQLRTGQPLPNLPLNGDFHLAGTQWDLAYQRSWSFVQFLVSRIGERRVTELYRRIADSPENTAAALREATGADTARLVREWHTWMRHVLGGR